MTTIKLMLNSSVLIATALASIACSGADPTEGPAGERGGVGPEGAVGADGAVGKDGANGSNGEDGADGASGLDGATILTGSEDPSADAGALHDLFINTVTRDVFKKGNDGWQHLTNLNSGSVGPQGEQGEQGETGEQGIQGEQGEQGIQGEQGEQGETGEQGIQGETGEQGPGDGFFAGIGTPSGACQAGEIYVDVSSGELYECNAQSWTLTGLIDGTRYHSGNGHPIDIPGAKLNDTYTDLDDGAHYKLGEVGWETISYTGYVGDFYALDVADSYADVTLVAHSAPTISGSYFGTYAFREDISVRKRVVPSIADLTGFTGLRFYGAGCESQVGCQSRELVIEKSDNVTRCGWKLGDFSEEVSVLSLTQQPLWCDNINAGDAAAVQGLLADVVSIDLAITSTEAGWLELTGDVALYL